MSLRYVRDDAHQRITATIWDPLVPDELYAVSDHQATAGTWRYGVLLDLRDLTQPPTADDVRRLIDHVRALIHVHGRRGPVATVSLQPAVYGMARMYEMLAEGAGLEVAAFKTINEAESWLSEHQRLPLMTPRPPAS